jgi:IS5 family transposase
MIRDRYEPLCLFDLVPQLELRFEPELAELDRLLDDDVLFAQVKADLQRRWPQSAVTGRPSTPVEVLLRLLVVKHLYQWSYEQTERYVADSLVLRQFCRLALEPVPDHTTLLRWANLLQPATLHRLLDRVTALARSLQVTRGRKLRLDSTVVETDIHYPADSTLLVDGVRVLSRLLRRAKDVVGSLAAAASEGGTAARRGLWRDRTRAATRLARRIGATLVRRPRGAAPQPEGDAAGAAGAGGAAGAAGTALRRALYDRLLAVAHASCRQAAQVRAMVEAGAARRASGPPPAMARLRAALERFLPLVERVIRQTHRRVLLGEQPPARDKVFSLFEPHTAVIRRGKVRQPTEFGAKLLLDEVEGGLVTGYTVGAGNADDAASLPASLRHHQACFGRPPQLLAADRHYFSLANERLATALGVRQVVLPKQGRPGKEDLARRARERAPWFRRGRRFRAGIEGRISVLRRRFGLRRCRAHGPAGLERWVGWGILAHNLRVLSRTLAGRREPAAALAGGPLAHHR